MKVILQLHAFSSVSFPGVPEKLRVNKAIGCSPLKDFYRNDSLDWIQLPKIPVSCANCVCSVPFPTISSAGNRVVSFGLVIF